MAEKIDLFDRKILYELDKDSRMPLSALAKKVKRDRASVNYRINQLIEKGIIQNFVALLDPGKIGAMVWNIYLQLQNTTKEIENDIVDYLSQKEKVWWIAKTTGRWHFRPNISCPCRSRGFFKRLSFKQNEHGNKLV